LSRSLQASTIIMADSKKQEQERKGTKMAREIRSKANKLPDGKRQALMGVAMELIHRGRRLRA